MSTLDTVRVACALCENAPARHDTVIYPEPGACFEGAICCACLSAVERLRERWSREDALALRLVTEIESYCALSLREYLHAEPAFQGVS